MTAQQPGSDGIRSGISFSPTIELGHIIQALVMVGALGGWALVGYQTIDKQINQHAAELALFKARLAADEASSAAAIAELRDVQRTTGVEVRQALAKISDQIADLRAVVAAQGKR